MRIRRRIFVKKKKRRKYFKSTSSSPFDFFAILCKIVTCCAFIFFLSALRFQPLRLMTCSIIIPFSGQRRRRRSSFIRAGLCSTKFSTPPLIPHQQSARENISRKFRRETDVRISFLPPPPRRHLRAR